MKDLISGDSAKAQLKVTELQLFDTEKKVILKDSVISILRKKEENYLMMVQGEKEKFEIQRMYSDRLEKDLKLERVKNKFKTAIGTGIIVVLSFFLIKN